MSPLLVSCTPPTVGTQSGPDLSPKDLRLEGDACEVERKCQGSRQCVGGDCRGAISVLGTKGIGCSLAHTQGQLDRYPVKKWAAWVGEGRQVAQPPTWQAYVPHQRIWVWVLTAPTAAPCQGAPWRQQVGAQMSKFLPSTWES